MWGYEQNTGAYQPYSYSFMPFYNQMLMPVPQVDAPSRPISDKRMQCIHLSLIIGKHILIGLIAFYAACLTYDLTGYIDRLFNTAPGAWMLVSIYGLALLLIDYLFFDLLMSIFMAFQKKPPKDIVQFTATTLTYSIGLTSLVFGFAWLMRSQKDFLAAAFSALTTQSMAVFTNRLFCMDDKTLRLHEKGSVIRLFVVFGGSLLLSAFVFTAACALCYLCVWFDRNRRIAKISLQSSLAFVGLFLLELPFLIAFAGSYNLSLSDIKGLFTTILLHYLPMLVTLGSLVYQNYCYFSGRDMGLYQKTIFGEHHIMRIELASVVVQLLLFYGYWMSLFSTLRYGRIVMFGGDELKLTSGSYPSMGHFNLDTIVL
ncbi:hypothetical protein NEHOM01_1427 [Nematocida homosporus]|uniref:uncharacterized protein n=1 Tax=Nematocida homosporus TaxID=1912981 RepID=UPI0022209A11|nr:uncharacterized protein NEHOM01_1427 [Nematocida homosporus]KAI5186373.1 hypothetical protein NEHOM01_1427 [Nematocida homosporus]